MRNPLPDNVAFDARTLAGLAAIALLAVVAFANSLAGDFVWDDRILVLEGRLPRAWDRLGEIFGRDFFHRAEVDNAYGYYRPLTTLSYVWDYSWWRLEPFGYHLTNVLLHAANSMLAALFLLRLGLARPAALFAAALFAAHPIHTESVAWISGRTDLLAFFFALLALDLRTRRGGPILAPLALFAGLLAKEMAIVAVAWAVLIDVVLGRRSPGAAVRASLPLAAAAAVYGVVRFFVLDIPGPGTPAEHTPVAVVLSLGPTLLRYLGWMLWPIAPSAYVIQPYVESLADPRFWLSWIGLAGLGYGLRSWARKAERPRPILAAAAMLGAAMLPLIGLWRPAGPADMGVMMAERFAYFPSLPFFALLGLGLDTLRTHRDARLRVATSATAAVFLVAAMLATIDRNRVWRDEQTFLEATLRAAPEAPLLWGRLVQHHLERKDPEAAARALRRARAAGASGREMLAVEAELLQQTGDVEEAIAAQERFVRTAAQARGPALNNLAVLYRQAGREAAARSLLERLVDEGKAYADVYANLAAVYRDAGEIDSAREMYARALRDRPDDLKTAAALVSLEVAAGRPEAAARIYEEQLRFHPGNRRLRNNLALLRANSGDDAAAAKLFAALVAEHPRYASARVNYAQVLSRLGRRDEARAQLRAARPLVRGTELEAIVERQLQPSRDGAPIPQPTVAHGAVSP